MPCCSQAPYSGNGDRIRGCTDKFCFFVFIILWFMMISIAAFAFVYGDPRRLINGYDSFGNTCGTSNSDFHALDLSGVDLSDRPFVFFLNVNDIGASMKLCVKECPNRHLYSLRDIELFYNETGSMLCRYGFNFTERVNFDVDPNITFVSPFGPCPVLPVFESSPLLNRCVPRAVREVAADIVGNLIAYLNGQEEIQQVVSDLYATWPEILGLIVLTFVISFVVVLIIYLLAAVMSAIIMVLVAISSIACTAVLWWTYVTIKTELDVTPTSQLLEESAKNERAFLIYSILATVFTVVLLSLVLYMRKRWVRVVELFREASNCLSSMPGLFLLPVFSFAVLVSFFLFWIFVIVCLATATMPGSKSIQPLSGSSELSGSLLIPPDVLGQNESMTEPMAMKRNKSIAGTFTFIEFIDPTWARYFWWVYLIGLVWTSEFILSCQQMAIAGAVAFWYFAPGSKKNLRHPIWRSLCNLFLYHLGSVAYGSCLITIFKVPRLILSFFKRECHKGGDDSACMKCCTKCCSCCCSFEKFLKYINHNAYTVIALEGGDFFPASKVAFNTTVHYASHVAAINSAGDFILFLGKCSVVAITGLIGLLLMKHNPHLHLYAVPIFIISVFAYFIAHCVLSLYEMVIDTLFLCYCEDINLNGASPESGLMMSESTRAFLFERRVDSEIRAGAIEGNSSSRVEHLPAD
ncbi:choline transporter-like 1 isoform X2 [Ischnura elegans]|uniref:choline transporter-like 1 isoform X2 n=1 Tax=Ischnura elegans TaxID=197161 RepID=UPI001ED8A3CF|nr:choline transporter-like 1 isoform X2 [Ischnura elegans]